MVESIFSSAARVRMEREPFPHAVIHNALSPEYYEALASQFPMIEQIAGSGALENNHIYLRDARSVLADESMPSIWQEFFRYHSSPDFFEELIKLWGDEIEAAFPDISENFGRTLSQFDVGLRQAEKSESVKNRDHDVVLDCLFGVNSPVRVSRSVRGPHLDSAWKLFSALLYFREPGDDCTGGEFEIYRSVKKIRPSQRKHIPKRRVERVKAVPYQANTCVVWFNTSGAIHGVSPRSVTTHERRYVAVTGECYGGKMPNEFFGLRPDSSGPKRRFSLARLFGG